MKKRVNLIAVVVFLLALSYKGKTQAINKQDSLALITLYDSTNGANWQSHYNWLTSAPVSQWQGITVTGTRVTAISLQFNNLTGKLPAAIGNLTNLAQLVLYYNKVTGPVPATITKLKNLTTLDVSQNLLTGGLPSNINNLTSLVSLNLFANKLSGNLPDALGSLSNLHELDLGRNTFSGNLPQTLGNLSQLTRLRLGENQFTGSIPASLGNLSHLISLECSSNRFDGVVPVSLANITTLIFFDLTNNLFNFSGVEAIAPLLGNKMYCSFQPLLTIHYSNGKLGVTAGGTLSNNTYKWYKNGALFTTVNGDSTLTIIGDASNYTVTVSNSVATQLLLNSNLLNLPQKVTANDSLALVELYNSTNGNNWTNNSGWLKGPVTNWYGLTLANNRVTNLNLASNNLTGTIPPGIGNLKALKSLLFNNNNLAGAIPASVTGIIALETLDFDNNKLMGGIPTGIVKLTNLTYLGLGYNNLGGTIPSNIGNLKKLVTLALGNTNIGGKLPATLAQIATLNRLDLSYNNITDSLPAWLGSLTLLQTLNLNNNNFSGTIPASFNNLHQLNILQLGQNKLSGDIPLTAPSFPGLLYMDISYNYYDFTPLEKITASFSYYVNCSPQRTHLHIYAIGNKLTVSAGGTLANNSYSWFLNNFFTQGIHGDSTVTPYFNGNYSVLVSNNKIGTFLSLQSDTVLVTSTANVQDSLALVKLYKSMGGTKWYNNASWLTSPVKKWSGITVNALGRVEAIRLSGYGLKGKMPAEIGNLTYLQALDISDNGLTDTLPSRLGTLAYLEELDLSNNHFAGNLPAWLSSLISIKRLYLDRNNFTGNIPVSLANLKNIELVTLGYNQLSGFVPAFLGGFSPNKGFGIGYNRYTFDGMQVMVGRDPGWYAPQGPVHLISDGKKLSIAAGGRKADNTYKWFTDTGVVSIKTGDSTYTPGALGKYWVTVTNKNITGLTLISDTFLVKHAVSVQDSLVLVEFYNSTNGPLWKVKTNWLKGPVATWYGVKVDTAGLVRELYFWNNNLTGNLPASIGKLTSLKYFSISDNNVTGGIPTEIGNMVSLENLNFTNTPFGGVLPPTIINLTNLKYLFFNNNNLTGSIPGEIGNLVNLVRIDFGVNQLTGGIPASIGKLKKLNSFFAGSNNLSGPIPVEFGNLTSLEEVLLSGNQLSGNLPASLSKLSKLRDLYLSGNRLTGSVPAFFASLPGLETLDISNNLFTGKVPGAFTTLTGLSSFYTYGNYFNFTGAETIARVKAPYNFYAGQNTVLKVQNKQGKLSVLAGGTIANNTYRWYKNGTLVSTKTGDSTYAATGAGKYNVVVTNVIAVNLSLYSDTLTATALMPGITLTESEKVQGKSIAGNTKLQLYPNPVINTAMLTFNTTAAGKYLIQVVTESGKVVEQLQKTLAAGTNNIVIDVYGLPSSVYFIKITNGINSQTVKFVKQ